MDKRSKKAIDVAVNYLGISSSTKSFPKGVQVEVLSGADVQGDDTGFFTELKENIDSLWHDNVGTLSRVPRMSATDFAYYVNQMRMERGAKSLQMDSPLIERWMKMMATADKKVRLIEVKSSEGRRLVLVRVP